MMSKRSIGLSSSYMIKCTWLFERFLSSFFEDPDNMLLWVLSELWDSWTTPMTHWPHMFTYSSILAGKFGTQTRSQVRG